MKTGDSTEFTQHPPRNIFTRYFKTMLYRGRHRTQIIPPDKPARGWTFWILVSAALLFVSGTSAVVAMIWYFSRELPPLEALQDYRPSLVTKVFGEGEELVGQFYVERRVLVPLDQIPESFRNAIVAVEDARFYEHKGVDPLGILRAMLANLESLSLRQGGSTITQQLARSLFLTQEKSFARKIREARLAWKIEKVLTKDQILEMYLNQIYFGHGAYGVQAAARGYFDKDVSELKLSEVSFIAGLPKAPTDFSPYSNPELAKRRQGVVLRRMVDQHYITEEEYQKTYQEDLYFKKPKKEKAVAPYFLEHVRQYLSSRYGDALVYKGGLKVYTTLSPRLQEAASMAMESGLRNLDKRQGFRGPVGRKTPEEIAALKEAMGEIHLDELEAGSVLEGVVTAVDDSGATVIAGGTTGKISPAAMSWAGLRLKGPDLSRDTVYRPDAKPKDILSPGDVIQVGVLKIDPARRQATFGLEQSPAAEGALISIDPRTGAIKAMVGGFDFERSEFNRAISARRQPGSAFKPIIYATALDRGMTPATVLLDSPIVYTDEETKKVWKPENYESKFYGPVSLRDALIHSRNLATVRLAEQIGVRNVIGFARKLGISSPLASDLSLALGSTGVSLLELTSAYGVFANEGVRVEPVAILSVKDSNGKILEEHIPAAEQVTSPETAYMVTNILVDVIQSGTGQRARVLKKALAGKTGTTNDFTDAWFVGYSPSLATGVWVGFDDLRSLGDREAGARAALPIWIEYNRVALDSIPETAFAVPKNIVYAKVDARTGLLAPAGAEDPVIEVFVKGTEPQKVAEPAPKPGDFFRLDAAVDF